MNREIKFRVWSTVHNNWTEFECFVGNGYVGLEEYSEDYITQQFTGLKDKNNKEIYEGDIVKTSLSHMFRKNIFEVTYYLNRFVPDDICDTADIEVIGNIFENPNLLKK